MSRLAAHHTVPREPGLFELDGDLEHVRLAVARIPEGETVDLDTAADEALIISLEAGAGAAVSAGDRRFTLPPRRSVFTDEPTAVFAPPGTTVQLAGPLLAAIFRAEAGPGAADIEPYLIAADEVETVHRGSGNFARRVRDILPSSRPATRLLAGETINPPGNWSSSPPHKHDRNNPPEEAELEEIYLFRVEPEQGFGLQLSYTTEPAAEQAHVIRDLDAVTIPAGYHPVVAGPGYGLYYLWCLAGEGRELHWFTDPAHAWVDAS